MKHVVVTRVSLALGAVFVTAACVFAWLANRPAPRPAPPAASMVAQLFESRCASCHSVEEMLRVLREAPDPQAKRRELETFLTSHGEATAEEDRAILDYLTSLVR
jgi:hypothetical protein